MHGQERQQAESERVTFLMANDVPYGLPRFSDGPTVRIWQYGRAGVRERTAVRTLAH